MKTLFESTQKFLSSKFLKPIEIMVLGVMLLWGFTKDLGRVAFFPDESFWVVSSVRLDKLIVGDFDSPIWTQDPIITFEVRPVPSYFTGISQRLGGISVESLPSYWDWRAPDEENIALGAMPSEEILWWSRLPMGIISAISLWLTAIFLANSHSRLAAYIFTLISFNGYFLLNLRRAMSEAPILLFTVLTIFASVKLMAVVRDGNMRKSIQWALIAGLFSGLAGQSKLTGLACAGIPILAVILVVIPHPVQWLTILKQRLLMIVIFIVIMATIATFIASYPLYYSDTVDRIWETFYARGQIIDYQLHVYTDELIPRDGRLEVLFQRIFDYPIHRNVNHTVGIIFHWLNLWVAIFGLYLVIVKARAGIPEQDAHLVLLLGTLLCAVPMLFNPFDWERYYLFPIYFSCIFFTVGLSQFLLNFRKMEKTK